jgi:hypothetical protein
MAIFEVEANGKRYQVEARDAADADAAINELAPTPSVGDYAKDAALSAVSGIPKGVANLVGMPAAMSDLMDRGVGKVVDAGEAGINRMRGKANEDGGYWPKQGVYETRQRLFNDTKLPDVTKALMPEALRGYVGDAVNSVAPGYGQLYEPKYAPGRYAGAAAENIPGALLGPGGMVVKALKYGVLPGLAGEAATDIPGVKGTAAEPWARGIANVVTAAGATRIGLPSSAERFAVRGSDHVTPEQWNAGKALQEVARDNHGVPLTGPEATQAAMGNASSNLANVQRVAEANSPKIGQYLADRPDKMRAAADNAFDAASGPRSINPALDAKTTASTATEVVGDARKAVNARSEPFYKAAETDLVSKAEFNNLRKTVPGFDEALAEVKNNKQLARYITGLPDRSVVVLDAVKQQLSEQANAVGSLTAGTKTSQKVAGGLSSDAAAVRDAAVKRSKSLAQALDIQEKARKGYELGGLDAGVAGKISRAEDGVTQFGALTEGGGSRVSSPGKLPETRRASELILAKDPDPFKAVVREGLGDATDKAFTATQGQSRDFAGAKLAKDLAGNPKTKANLADVLDSMNPAAAKNVQEALDVLGATGNRMGPGSATTWNRRDLEEMGRSGALNTFFDILNPVKGISRITEGVHNFAARRYSDKLADLLTAEDSVARLQRASDAMRNQRGNAAGRAIMGYQNADQHRPVITIRKQPAGN